MAGKAIQGFFVGGRIPAALTGTGQAMVQRKSVMTENPSRAVPGPPPPAFGGGARPAQAHAAPGRPPSPIQRHGGADSFAVDPVQLGLARGGGSPLPKALLGKMEAAFGADFSTVRVHVGPQAARIGAIAFTTGNDLYFAPGRYQPDSVQGQQLIGHELAHVIQQRQGRVRTPGNGVAVVQDHALEAEADRLGMRAAMHRAAPEASSRAVQRKSGMGSNAVTASHATARPGRPPLAHAGRSDATILRFSAHRTIQRMDTSDSDDEKMDTEIVSYGGGHSRKFIVLHSDWEDTVERKSDSKIKKMFSSGRSISGGRGYDKQRVRQMLRWIASLIYKKYPKCVEIQCYFYNNIIYISSNKTSVNNAIRSDLDNGFLTVLKSAFSANFPSNMKKDMRDRISAHGRKLLSNTINDGQEDVWEAIKNDCIFIPKEDYSVDLHAERRIRNHLKIKLDPDLLGGVKRACAVCAIALDIYDEVTVGPLWPSSSALGGLTLNYVKQEITHNEILTTTTKSKRTGEFTFDYDSDSDSDDEAYK